MACMLDKNFIPMINVLNDFKKSVAKEQSQRLVIRIERNKLVLVLTITFQKS